MPITDTDQLKKKSIGKSNLLSFTKNIFTILCPWEQLTCSYTCDLKCRSSFRLCTLFSRSTLSSVSSSSCFLAVASCFSSAAISAFRAYNSRVRKSISVQVTVTSPFSWCLSILPLMNIPIQSKLPMYWAIYLGFSGTASQMFPRLKVCCWHTGAGTLAWTMLLWVRNQRERTSRKTLKHARKHPKKIAQ